ncbi:MAG: adenine-specific DNA-methyltransferase [Mucilaginibacter sp.]|nr:adenine-specific DNA-methyltransferase [Mucilaginibacter sp.]
MSKNKHQKLELNWIGKGDDVKLEPRILIEEPSYSYGSHENDNMLIYGDNLLALKSLEQDFSGKIKCICIDPPYNTGSAFEHYDDGVEHSLWLQLMHDRLKILHKLLSNDGTIWIAIDDNEVHYLKVMCDEIFGRANFVTGVAWRSADSSNNDSKKFSIDHNTILVYSKNPDWLSYQLDRTEDANAHYKNPDNDPLGPWFPGNLSSPNPRPNLRYNVVTPSGNEIISPTNGWRWSKERMAEMIERKEIIFTNNETKVLKKTYLYNQKGLAPSSIWFDIDDTGHNRQAKYELMKIFPNVNTSDLFKTPKPEKLIVKILKIATKEDDYVLDSFLGSGTTAAVAHKMKRKWIGVELGEQAKTYCYPRLKKVVDGEQGGVSKAVNWQGGGGFKFYTLASSLLNQDKYGNWIISKNYNGAMLAAAMTKQEGFQYRPDESTYWKQGQSSEQDFIFTTTQFITLEGLEHIYNEMKDGDSLLICCKAYQQECKNMYPNITIKKIPQMLLGRCEFGKDDYSLNIVNIPIDSRAESDEDELSVQEILDNKNAKNTKDQQSLF